MTWQTAQQVWSLNLPCAQKYTLYFLALREGPEGCFPSEATIGKNTGQSERACRRNLKKLEKDGWITIQRERDRSNRYTLNLTKATSTIDALQTMIKGPAKVAAPMTGQSGRTMRPKPSKGPAKVAGDREINKRFREPAKMAGPITPGKSNDTMSLADWLTKNGTTPQTDGRGLPTATETQPP